MADFKEQLKDLEEKLTKVSYCLWCGKIKKRRGRNKKRAC